MTTSERVTLVNNGCEGSLVMRMDGLGWSFADIKYLLSAGLDFDKIEAFLNIGAGYAEIKTEADNLKRQAKNKKIDAIGESLFGERPTIISNTPSIQNSKPLNITAKILETGVQGIGKLVFFGIKKARKK